MWTAKASEILFKEKAHAILHQEEKSKPGSWSGVNEKLNERFFPSFPERLKIATDESRIVDDEGNNIDLLSYISLLCYEIDKFFPSEDGYSRTSGSMIILDTMLSLADLEDENNNAQVSMLMNRVTKLRDELGCCVILAMHASKAERPGLGKSSDASQSIRGAGASADRLDFVLELGKMEQKQNKDLDGFALHLVKNRLGEVRYNSLELIIDEPIDTGIVTIEGEKRTYPNWIRYDSSWEEIAGDPQAFIRSKVIEFCDWSRTRDNGSIEYGRTPSRYRHLYKG